VVIISTPGELVEQAVLLLWRRGGTKSAPDLVEQSRFLLRLVMPTERVPDLIKQTWFLVLRLGRFFVFLPVVCLEKPPSVIVQVFAVDTEVAVACQPVFVTLPSVTVMPLDAL